MSFKRLALFIGLMSASLTFGVSSVSAETVGVGVGFRYEVCYDLEEGDTIAYSYKAEMPLYFNFHYHVGDQVIYLLKIYSKKELEEQTYVAGSDRQYCMMWDRNDWDGFMSYEVSLVQEDGTRMSAVPAEHQKPPPRKRPGGLMCKVLKTAGCGVTPIPR